MTRRKEAVIPEINSGQALTKVSISFSLIPGQARNDEKERVIPDLPVRPAGGPVRQVRDD
jgi:hypothetical protein